MQAREAHPDRISFVIRVGHDAFSAENGWRTTVPTYAGGNIPHLGYAQPYGWARSDPAAGYPEFWTASVTVALRAATRRCIFRPAKSPRSPYTPQDFL